MTLNKFPVRPDKWTLRRRRLVGATAIALICSSFAGLSAMKSGNAPAAVSAQSTGETGGLNKNSVDTKKFRLTRTGKHTDTQKGLQKPQINVPLSQGTNPASINSASIYNAGYRDGYNHALTETKTQAQIQAQTQSQTQAPNRPVTAVHPHSAQPAPDNRTYFQKHPMIKGAAIGAGVGGGAGALTGLVTGQGIFRGAAIGATTGAGVGAIRTSRIMKRHPIVQDIATGGLTGLGLGWAGSHYSHTIAATTGVGAAIGLGAGLFNNLR